MAQVTTLPVTPMPVTKRGTTTLQLAADVANGIIAPGAGSRVRVPPDDTIVLQAPENWPVAYVWTKDGKTLPGKTERRLTIAPTVSADTGYYTLAGAPWPTICTGALVEVAPLGHMGNFSARVELAPGTQPQVVGFVVNGKSTKNLLVRAVGPSLSAFGLAKPAAQPRLRFYDAQGKELIWAYPAVVIDWTPIFAAAGAFPLTGGERERIAFTTVALEPGAYTLHVSDDSQKGGTALVEVYEIL